MKKVFMVTALAVLPAFHTANAEVIISPRVSYYFDNSNLRVSDLSSNIQPDPVVDQARTQRLQDVFGDDALLESQSEGSGQTADQVTFPMYGGAITVGDDRDRFTLNALYGSGKGRVDTVFTSSQRLSVGDVEFLDLAVIRANDRIKTDKFDLELTWQRRLNEKFAVFAGVRYERLETGGPVIVRRSATNNIDNFFAELDGVDGPTANIEAKPLPQRLNTKSKLETYSLRAGVTAFVPVNQSLIAFFNGMAHVSNQPKYTVTDTLFGVNDEVIGINEFSNSGEISAGPDIAVGAQFLITDNISFDVRYRAILFFPLSGDFSFSDARVNHGVNMGVSFRL